MRGKAGAHDARPAGGALCAIARNRRAQQTPRRSALAAAASALGHQPVLHIPVDLGHLGCVERHIVSSRASAADAASRAVLRRANGHSSIRMAAPVIRAKAIQIAMARQAPTGGMIFQPPCRRDQARPKILLGPAIDKDGVVNSRHWPSPTVTDGPGST